MVRALQRFRSIFSGKRSEDMWNDIKRVKSAKTREALYDLATRCQELESVVESLEERIAQIEKDG